MIGGALIMAAGLVFGFIAGVLVMAAYYGGVKHGLSSQAGKRGELNVGKIQPMIYAECDGGCSQTLRRPDDGDVWQCQECAADTLEEAAQEAAEVRTKH
jgi:hypothetical protein